MEDERQALIMRKVVVEQQVAKLKPQVKALRKEQSNDDNSTWVEILNVLLDIRDLLRRQND